MAKPDAKRAIGNVEMAITGEPGIEVHSMDAAVFSGYAVAYNGSVLSRDIFVYVSAANCGKGMWPFLSTRSRTG